MDDDTVESVRWPFLLPHDFAPFHVYNALLFFRLLVGRSVLVSGVMELYLRLLHWFMKDTLKL